MYSVTSIIGCDIVIHVKCKFIIYIVKNISNKCFINNFVKVRNPSLLTMLELGKVELG